MCFTASVVLMVVVFSATVTERTPQSPCTPSPCGPNAECRERNNAGSCVCAQGYQGNPYDQEHGCRRGCDTNIVCAAHLACISYKCIDPCPGTCGQNAECRVENHISACTCAFGYSGDPFFHCHKIPSTPIPRVDPCLPSPCGPNSQCKNINNQAVCSCLPAYSGSPPECRPECVVSSECTPDKRCINQKCVDPCPNTCGLDAQCTANNHNPICTCPIKFTGDPLTKCFPLPKNGNGELLVKLLPHILSNTLTLIYKEIVHIFGNCSLSEGSAPKTEYWIYTRDYPEHPRIVTEPDIVITPNRSKIIFLAHGWISNASNPYVAVLKDAYLIRYDAYIISINYGPYALQNYSSAVCDLPAVARNAAEFLCKLKQQHNVSLTDVHGLGHSLGGQLIGLIGSSVYSKCRQKLGRLTGLDPAGPLYSGADPAYRLDPTDADFVDAMHTNIGGYGYVGKCGHVDAYMNCGYVQPGCFLNLTMPNWSNITSVMQFGIDYILCGHTRSSYFFAESINSNNFVGQPCVGCGLPKCRANYLATERKMIGEDCRGPGRVRKYLVHTNALPPYAKG